MANLINTIVNGDLTLNNLNIKCSNGEVTSSTPTLLNLLYPVGSIFMSITQKEDTQYITGKEGCPLADYFGRWRRIAQGRTLVQANPTFPNYTETVNGNNYSISFPSPGATGGYRDVKVVKHTHTVTSSKNRTNLNTTKKLGNIRFRGINDTAYRVINSNRTDGTIITAGDGTGIANVYEDNNSDGYPAKITFHAKHTHTLPKITTGESNGGTGEGANMQPYYVVYMWERLSDEE